MEACAKSPAARARPSTVGVSRTLLADVGQRLFDFFVGDGNLRLVGAQILVALDLNFRQHFEAGLESQGLAVVNVQIGHAGLRNRDEALLLGFPAKIFRNQRFDHIVLKAVAEALPNDRSRHVPGAKARQPRAFLIAHNLQLGLAHNFGGGDLDRDLPLDVFIIAGTSMIAGTSGAGRFSLSFSLGVFSSLCGAHVTPFASRCLRRLRRTNEAKPNLYGVHFECKERSRQRQTVAGRAIGEVKILDCTAKVRHEMKGQFPLHGGEQMEENKGYAPTAIFPRVESHDDARVGCRKEYGACGPRVSDQSEAARSLERRVASQR
jgi:hypothetical protein